MKTLLYLGSIGAEVSTYVTKLMKICCLIITAFLGLSACVDVPPPPPQTNIRIASVSVDASRAIWKTRANERAYVSAQKLEKAFASAVQRKVSPLAQGSRAVAVTLTVTDVTFNNQKNLFGYLTDLGGSGPHQLHSWWSGSLKITDAQSGEILSELYPRRFVIIHEKKWPVPENIQWSENEVNKNLGEFALHVADDVACSMFHVSCYDIWTGLRK